MPVLSEADAFQAEVFADISDELERALPHGDFSSLHEAWAVMEEELDEVHDIMLLKKRDRDPVHLRAELIQLAAMAVKGIENIDNFVGGTI